MPGAKEWPNLPHILKTMETRRFPCFLLRCWTIQMKHEMLTSEVRSRTLKYLLYELVFQLSPFNLWSSVHVNTESRCGLSRDNLLSVKSQVPIGDRMCRHNQWQSSGTCLLENCKDQSSHQKYYLTGWGTTIKRELFLVKEFHLRSPH